MGSVIDNKFDVGAVVYLRTDSNQYKRLVTAILIKPAGLQYELSCGTDSSWHWDFEISVESNVLISTTN